MFVNVKYVKYHAVTDLALSLL